MNQATIKQRSALINEACPECGGKLRFTGFAPPSRFPDLQDSSIERLSCQCKKCGKAWIINNRIEDEYNGREKS